MGKNKIANVTAQNVDVKSNFSESFDPVKFTKALQDDELAVKALQKFLKTNRQLDQTTVECDVVKEYVSHCVQCSELFKCLTRWKSSPTKLSVLFETFTIILMRTCDDLSNLTGLAITKRILQEYIDSIYACLSLRNSSDTISATLRMLSAIVMQGNACAADVVINLDLSSNVMKSLASYHQSVKSNARKPFSNVRVCFVRFVLSFFLNGNLKTIRQVLEARGFVDSVFRGFKKDSKSLVALFLSTILDVVIKEISISKTNKVKLLAAHGVLSSIADLLEWEGSSSYSVEQVEKDILSKDMTDDEILLPQVAYKFLFECCCSVKHGIIFHDNEFGTGLRSCNHVMQKFLVNLKSASTNPFAHLLVVNILKACPDILGTYLHAATLTFDPRPTAIWFQNCRLVLDIYSHQPKVAPALNEATRQHPGILQNKFATEKLVAMLTPAILPICFHRSNMNATLKHESKEVEMVGLKILESSLQKLNASITFLEEEKNWKKSIYNEMDRIALCAALKLEMKNQLPDITTLLLCWKAMSKEDKGKEKEFEEKSLLGISLYQEIFPDSLNKCQFDFSLLLQGLDNNGLPENKKNIVHILDILFHSAYKYKWFKKGVSKKTLFHQLVYVLVETIKDTSGKDNHVLETAMQLVTKVLIINKIMDENSSGLFTWIYNLGLASDGQSQDQLLQFFEKTVASVAKRPHRYYEKAMAIIESTNDSSIPKDNQNKTSKDIPYVEIDRLNGVWKHFTGTNLSCAESSKVEVSLMLVSAFEQLSFFANDEGNKSLQSLDRWLSLVLTDLLHSNTIGSSLDDFVRLVIVLSCEVPLLHKFHSLSELVQTLAIGEGIKFSSSKKIMTQDDYDKTISYTQHENNIKTILPDNVLTFLRSTLLPDSEDLIDIIIKRYLNVAAISTAGKQDNMCCSSFFQSWCSKQKLYQQLYLLKKVSIVFESDLPAVFDPKYEVMNILTETGLKICSFFFAYLNWIYDQTAPRLSSSDESNPLFESLFCDHHSRVVGNFPIPETSTEDFLVLLQKILLSDIFSKLYLSKSPHYQAKLTSYFSERALYLVKLRCKSKHDVPLNFPPFELVVDSVSAHLSGQDSSPVSVMGVQHFDQLLPYMDRNNVNKVLNIALTCRNCQKAETVQIICSCVLHLLKSCAVLPDDPLLKNSVHFLFQTLVSGEPKADSFIEMILHKVKLHSAYAMLAKEKVISWCFRNSKLPGSITMLELLVSKNPHLQECFVRNLCDKDSEMSLSKLSTDKKVQLVSPITSILEDGKQSSLLLNQDFLHLLEKSYAQLLIDDLMEQNPVFLDCEKAFLIAWMMEHGVVSTQYMQNLSESIHEAFQDVAKFQERWLVASQLLKEMQKINLSEDISSLCLNLLQSLMTLSCKLMKRDDGNNAGGLMNVSKTLSDVLDQNVTGSIFNLRNSLWKVWNNYVKLALKYCFFNPMILEFVTKFILNFYDECNNAEIIKASTIFEMIKTHSAFLKLLLSELKEDAEVKTSLVKLLHCLIKKCDADQLQLKDFSFLLSAYGGTLSISDQYLYQMMLIYESKGISMKKFSPFLWGAMATDAYKLKQKKAENLFLKNSPNKVLDCLDADIMQMTLEYFPLRRKMPTVELISKSDTNRCLFADEIASSLYDPCFLLCAVSHMLSPAHYIDCKRFAEQKLLSFLLVCLSSHCKNVRHLSAQCILRYFDHAQSSRFPQNNLILHLISCIRNAVTTKSGAIKKLPFVIAFYLAKLVQLLFQPADHMFSVMYRFLLVKPEIDLTNIPEFYATFFSSESEYKIERVWTLDLLRTGLRDMSDYKTIERRQLFRILMSYTESPTSDNFTRQQVLQIIVKASKIRGALFDLIDNQALIPWLVNITLIQNKQLAIHDSGETYTQRGDSTCDIINVILSLWQTLDVVRVEHNQTTAEDESNVTEKAKFRQVSRRLAESVISLCFDVLTNILFSYNGHKTAENSDNARVGSGTAESTVEIIKVISRASSYADTIAARPRRLEILSRAKTMLASSGRNISEILDTLMNYCCSKS
ncbi:unnamed protein product [Clavelina lepadiformis]|uniref:Nucleolar pre-ribosomal-associated protein 1 n=1 Tax=Clavelina lepadiformis TaxID=159417 RepID=A0ABP0G4X7_CLALP